MIAKYHIEYALAAHKGSHELHYQTDDPVAAESFLTDLLDEGASIHDIKHDGVPLPRHDFDKMVKAAAGMLAARRVCLALGIKPEEERWRFGFAA